jgi:uncharacterized linocin/CFP29 family protein
MRRRGGPLSERVWTALEGPVVAAARHVLAARRVATFDGPRGWEHVAAPLGTLATCETRDGGAVVCVPDVVLLAEIRGEFRLPWSAVDAFERGAPALDTSGAEAAARAVALAEDRLAFYGEPVGSGFLASPRSPRVQAGDWSRPGRVVADLLSAARTLDEGGIPGPYEAILALAAYYAYHAAVQEGGYPAREQLEGVVAAVHRSAAVREPGALFSTRGGDFVLTVGGDLGVGYRFHDRDAVYLVVDETVATRLVTPEAVCVLGP